jgi:solute carrier family 6 GABA transporter-like protein 1
LLTSDAGTGVGFGFYTAYASYNREAAHSCQDAVIIAYVNATFEVILKFAVFGIVGFLGITPESTGVIGSYSIGFITYPEAFMQIPASNFFAVLLFFTLMLVGISSSFAMLDAVMTLIMDSPFAKRWGRPWVATALDVVCFLLSLPNCTQFGYWYLDGVDRWMNNVGLVFVVWAECVVATTAYLYKDVVGQVGLPSFASYNAGYLGGQLRHHHWTHGGPDRWLGGWLRGLCCRARPVLAPRQDSGCPRCPKDHVEEQAR